MPISPGKTAVAMGASLRAWGMAAAASLLHLPVDAKRRRGCACYPVGGDVVEEAVKGERVADVGVAPLLTLTLRSCRGGRQADRACMQAVSSTELSVAMPGRSLCGGSPSEEAWGTGRAAEADDAIP